MRSADNASTKALSVSPVSEHQPARAWDLAADLYDTHLHGIHLYDTHLFGTHLSVRHASAPSRHFPASSIQ